MDIAYNWAVLGVLTTLLVWAMAQMGGGLRSLRDEMKGSLGSLRNEVESQREILTDVRMTQTRHESRFDIIDSRFDIVDSRFENIDTRFDNVEEQARLQGERLSTAIYGLAEKLDEHLRWHAS